MKQNNSLWEIEFYSPSGGAIDGTPIGNGQIGAMLEAHQSVVNASLVIGAIPTFLIFLFCQGIIMRGIIVPTEK